MSAAAQTGKAERFLAAHVPGRPLLMPNAWDAGSAALLASLGFEALATTSSGFAATLGRLDGEVTRDEAIAHSAQLAAATEVPVSADLENGFADDPAGVAETARMAVGAGLAGFSIEDYTGRDEDPVYDAGRAAERVAAAARAAHAGPARLVLTARSENHIRGRDDLPDTIARLRAYEEAGADVLFAPGLTRIEDIRAVVEAVGVPVSVLALAATPPVAELAAAGVARVSVGLREEGTFGYWARAAQGGRAARAAFGGEG